MFISHQNIYLIFAQRHVSTNYKLDIVICSDYLSHITILMFTSTPFSSRLWNSLSYQSVGTTTANSFKSLLRDHYIGLNS